MKGRIIKGIAGFFYVYVEGAGVYECKAKGILRTRGLRPLVGDEVLLSVVDGKEKIGNVDEILPRKMELLRPAISNVDAALVIFSCQKPQPNWNLLDRFLCWMERQKLPAAICMNKSDLVESDERTKIQRIYEAAGYPLFFTSTKTSEGLDTLRKYLRGKTVTVAGPSGVGKSSLINSLLGERRMETGNISEKIDRGKHTTRHSELLPIGEETFIIDTPGFGSLQLPEMEEGELWSCYPEFGLYEPQCRFGGCSHISEPVCGVKDALKAELISPVRYDNYRLLYQELRNQRKY